MRTEAAWYKKTWVLSIIGIVVAVIFGISACLRRTPKTQMTTTQNVAGTGNNINFNNAAGNVIVNPKPDGAHPREDLRVDLQMIPTNGGWDRYQVNVTNIGTIEVVLEKAQLFCNRKLIGATSMMRTWETPTDNPSIKSVHRGYPRLAPGDRVDDIVPEFGVQDPLGKAADPQSCKGTLEARLLTTRGAKFSGFQKR